MQFHTWFGYHSGHFRRVANNANIFPTQVLDNGFGEEAMESWFHAYIYVGGYYRECQVSQEGNQSIDSRVKLMVPKALHQRHVSYHIKLRDEQHVRRYK